MNALIKLDGKAIGALLLRILLSAVFFYTALAKVFPIEVFEYTLVEIGLYKWNTAALLSRTIVGFEFAFSLLLLLGTKWKVVERGLLAFLGILSLYLILLLIRKGNVADCGCLGAFHSISPLMSLLKNMVMTGMILLIGYWGVGPRIPFYPGTLSLIVTLGCLGVPFIVDPPEQLGPSSSQEGKVANFPMKELKELMQGKEAKLDSGKRILAFMSTTCHWCRLATRKLGIIEEQTRKELPYHFFLYGTEKGEKRFWKKTRAGPYPSMRISREKLLKFAKGMVPALVLVEDGKAVARLGFNDIGKRRIVHFLEKE